jgi:DNA-binding NarL/FixJ family response regulator
MVVPVYGRFGVLAGPTLVIRIKPFWAGVRRECMRFAGTYARFFWKFEQQGSQFMARARIFIVDDHPLVREGLTARISGQSGLEICGQSGDAKEALQLISQHQPDLALIDLSLNDASGLDLIHRLHAHFPAIKLIVISMYDEAIYGPRARSSGARGYINKREISQQVIDAINRVLSGKVYFSKKVASSAEQLSKLSNRESQVFELIAQGMTMSAIAEQLHVSVKTVETHRENIKTKLDLKSSHALTIYASRMAVLPQA